LLLNELEGVENMFVKSIEVAEKTQTMMSKQKDQTS